MLCGTRVVRGERKQESSPGVEKAQDAGGNGHGEGWEGSGWSSGHNRQDLLMEWMWQRSQVPRLVLDFCLKDSANVGLCTKLGARPREKDFLGGG